MQAWVLAVQQLGLEVADGVDGLVADDVGLLGDACQVLEGVEQKRRGGAEARGGAAADDLAVGQHQGAGWLAGGLLLGEGRRADGGEVGRDAGLLHEHLQLAYLVGATAGALCVHTRAEVAADDFHPGCVAHGLVVTDGKACHVDAHVRRRLVGACTQNALHHGLEHGERLDVAVVVDRHLAVGLQVEGVDDVGVVQVGRGGLVGEVHRVLERQVPHGERLVLGVAGFDAVLGVEVDLRQARGHLARAGAGGRHDHKRAGRFDVVVLAEALVAYHVVHVHGVAGDGVVAVGAHAHGVEARAEDVGGGLAGVARHDDGAHKEAHALEDVDEAQDVLVVGDAQVAADLAALDVVGVDGNDDLHVVLEALQHADLLVRGKAGQDARGVHVIEQLAAELKVELAAERADTLADVGGLQFDVFLAVESNAHSASVLSCSSLQRRR